MDALLRWYYTIHPLKREQLWCRLTRRIAMAINKPANADASDIALAMKWPQVSLHGLNVLHRFEPDKRRFSFLNRTVAFPAAIDWNYSAEGLLWTYNLAYFEWLYDDTVSAEARLATIQEFVAADCKRLVASDAYPASLRIMAWIRFVLTFGIKDVGLLSRLYADADWLCRFPEHHIQGNHLWENAMGILCAGIYFRNEHFLHRGESLLTRCIAEQLLPDGGHVEGSPMYHSLLLWRLMQCFELLMASGIERSGLSSAIAAAIGKMLGWMQAITFSDGTWPQFNDCAPGIAPDTRELLRYSALLGIKPERITLKESGYRMICCGDIELAIDVAPVQPANQPGHAHADIGTFCLYYMGRPVIVDNGTSTYEPGPRRNSERGTAAHNTVTIGPKDSSEVWKSFRVGRRARLLQVGEQAGGLTVVYQPYGYYNVVHRRTFSWTEHGLDISDEIKGAEALGYCAQLHFHPDADVRLTTDQNITVSGLTLEIAGTSKFAPGSYQFAAGFNKYRSAVCAGIPVQRHLKIHIHVQDEAPLNAKT